MKKCFVMLSILLSWVLFSQLVAQDTPAPAGTPAAPPPAAATTPQTAAATEENPGNTGRLVDFNNLGKANPVQQYLAIENWLVKLNDSANYNQNRELTYAINAKNNAGNKNYIGIRINFPDFPNNAYGTATPPLPFPYYGEAESGVIKNVGAIRSVIARVAGRNYPYSVFVNVQHSSGKIVHAPLGRIEFLGWRDLSYENPEYIKDIKQRTLQIRPAYPRVVPSARLNDIIFFRNGEAPYAGDFVSYVAWVDIVYDNAFANSALESLKESEDYIDDDATWGIISNELQKVESELFKGKLDRYRYLERLEREKMNLPPLDGGQ
ncbi:hypothetical protein COTS27_01512 [Spirochaetota bacterium]|nr:hypothetical protein COTS27_01512 [Spirochaetota bacterium]